MSLFGVSNKTDNISPIGTFARVCLCRHKTSSNFFALKILSLHDVIRLKQVDHVKNEKNILKVPNHHLTHLRGDFAYGDFYSKGRCNTRPVPKTPRLTGWCRKQCQQKLHFSLLFALLRHRRGTTLDVRLFWIPPMDFQSDK